MSDDIDALHGRVAELEAREEQHARAATVQDALYRIAEAASAADDLQAFYATVHRIVGSLMYAENAYIALYDEQRRAILPLLRGRCRPGTPGSERVGADGHRPGARDNRICAAPRQASARDGADHARTDGEGRGRLLGVIADGDWLGAPLVAEGHTLGVIVVQSYTNDHLHTEADRDLLAFVGQHIGTALSRARAIEETRQRNTSWHS